MMIMTFPERTNQPMARPKHCSLCRFTVTWKKWLLRPCRWWRGTLSGSQSESRYHYLQKNYVI